MFTSFGKREQDKRQGKTCQVFFWNFFPMSEINSFLGVILPKGQPEPGLILTRISSLEPPGSAGVPPASPVFGFRLAGGTPALPGIAPRFRGSMRILLFGEFSPATHVTRFRPLRLGTAAPRESVFTFCKKTGMPFGIPAQSTINLNHQPRITARPAGRSSTRPPQACSCSCSSRPPQTRSSTPASSPPAATPRSSSSGSGIAAPPARSSR